MNLDTLKPVILSYLRAAAASAIALYMSGVTDPKVLLNALLAGLAGPVLKALDTSAKEFGLGSEAAAPKKAKK